MISETLPTIIQGGMGAAVSSWELARAVSQAGELGVVSGTALDVVCARRLQMGDPGGHMRRALAHFPVPAVARRVMKQYYAHGGIGPAEPFRAVPRFTVDPSMALQELTVVGTFCEVWLAKEGHDGAVGVNFLRKIEMPMPFGLLGAMLAGVDYVIVGAGNPAELPEMIRTFARGDDVRFGIRAQGMRSDDPPVEMVCSPREILGSAHPVAVPRFLAIVSSVDLAAGLAGSPRTRPFGFVLEGPSAGGHNAPPRGPRRVDDLGQPIYDERDSPDVAALAALGLPFWMAGSFGTPEGLARARAEGAVGVQVGTAFAYCAESGMAEEYKSAVLTKVLDGTVEVISDWRASPTGFPFKVVQLEGTVSDDAVAAARQAVCDIGALRVPFKKKGGGIDYRCPAEPLAVYTGRKGGRPENAEGRRCLCNALLSAAGLPQHRPSGTAEPAIITSGDDFSAVRDLQESLLPGQAHYSARAVIEHLRTGLLTP